MQVVNAVVGCVVITFTKQPIVVGCVVITFTKQPIQVLDETIMMGFSSNDQQYIDVFVAQLVSNVQGIHVLCKAKYINGQIVLFLKIYQAFGHEHAIILQGFI